jgi:tRNA(Ile2) C34 agmatinyltransferase TiaS
MGSGYELAKAAESLAGGGGHGGLAAVLKMTPRRIAALLQLRDRRRLGERAELASIIRAAVNADEKAFARMIKKMDDDAQ